MHQKQKDSYLQAVDFAEAHIGCRFADILSAEGAVVSAGLLTLFVFPKNNDAHKKFLKDSKVRRNFLLAPSI
jgi:hypothetical protein